MKNCYVNFLPANEMTGSSSCMEIFVVHGTPEYDAMVSYLEAIGFEYMDEDEVDGQPCDHYFKFEK